MLIAEFAETTGLTRDAVRFYVKHGLLRPSVSSNGNRYQHFDEADIERVILIQSGQSLGFTIRQIKGFSEEFEAGKMDHARQIAVLSEQLAALEQQASLVNAMRAYLKKKIAWMKGGEVGPAPKLKGKSSAGCSCQPNRRIACMLPVIACRMKTKNRPGRSGVEQ